MIKHFPLTRGRQRTWYTYTAHFSVLSPAGCIFLSSSTMQRSHSEYAFIVHQQNPDCVLTRTSWRRFTRLPPSASFALVESSLPKYKAWLYVLYINNRHRVNVGSRIFQHRKRRRSTTSSVRPGQRRLYKPRTEHRVHAPSEPKRVDSPQRRRRSGLSESDTDDWSGGDTEQKSASSRAAL